MIERTTPKLYWTRKKYKNNLAYECMTEFLQFEQQPMQNVLRVYSYSETRGGDQGQVAIEYLHTLLHTRLHYNNMSSEVSHFTFVPVRNTGYSYQSTVSATYEAIL